MLQIKKTITNEQAFDGLISKLDIGEEIISKLEDISMQTSKTKTQTEQRD